MPRRIIPRPPRPPPAFRRARRLLRHHGEEQERREDHERTTPSIMLVRPRAEPDRADEEGQREQRDVLRRPGRGSAGYPRSRHTATTTGIVRPMLASAEPRARFMLVCRRSASAERIAARDSGMRTRSAIATPTTSGGAPASRTAASIVGESTFASPTTATSATSRSAKLAQRLPGGGRRGVDGFVGGGAPGRQEVVTMADGLEEHEHAPHHEGRDGHEAELRRRVARPLRADGEGRHHQHQRHERGERRQRRAGALDPEALLPVAQRAEQHAGADDAVGDDHDGRVHRVARERGLVSRRRRASPTRSGTTRWRSPPARGPACRRARRPGAPRSRHGARPPRPRPPARRRRRCRGAAPNGSFSAAPSSATREQRHDHRPAGHERAQA